MKQTRPPWPKPGSALPDRLLRDGWWLADPRPCFDPPCDDLVQPQPHPPYRNEEGRR